MPPILTIANVLTFARLILLPVVIVGIVTSQGWITVAGMALVLLTDLLDGRIARRLRQAAQFGKALDSTVDFVLIYSLFIAFYAAGRLATYQFAILYVAMLTILSVQLLTQSSGTIASPVTGKLLGALEYVFLLFLTVREVLPEAPLLASLGLGLFLMLAGAIAVNTIVCLRIIVTATRPASDASSGGGSAG
ncbi:MAG: CDP-alcohol phosphatidyltransferase family protein [Armatimonadota bacterium]|nr:MAG: CDP-alcohol phosphatidyltransferase family protein [Armatimonadota bacterium]